MSRPLKSREKPNLDELFAIKRAERPDDAFWVEFERGLRQKQLAAIVLPRPWWHAPSLWARKAAPYGGFAAAAAALALALAFTSLRSPVAFADRPVAVRPAEEVRMPATSPGEVAASVEVQPATSLATPPVASADASPALASVDDSPVSVVPTAPVSAAKLAPVVVAASAAEPILSAPETSPARQEAAPVASAPVFSAEPVLVDALAAQAGALLADAAVPEATPADALVVAPPAVLRTRHDRILAKALEDAPGEADRSLAQVRDRVVHRLADGEALYASITRVGVSGDRLSLKF